MFRKARMIALLCGGLMSSSFVAAAEKGARTEEESIEGVTNPGSTASVQTARSSSDGDERLRQALVDELVDQGVARAEAQRRVAALSDQEMAEVRENLDEVPAGGDDTITLSVGTAVVIVLLLIIFF